MLLIPTCRAGLQANGWVRLVMEGRLQPPAGLFTAGSDKRLSARGPRSNPRFSLRHQNVGGRISFERHFLEDVLLFGVDAVHLFRVGRLRL